MAAQIYNNVTVTLTASVGSSDTSISVSDGSAFPDPSPTGDYIPVYVYPDGGAHEIMHVTGVSGNTLTVTRAEEGTDPLTFDGTESVQIRPTRQSLSEMDASSMSVDSSTGTQTVSDALDQRVIYVDKMADLQALVASGLLNGQAAIVQGSEFIWSETAEEWNPTGPVSIKSFGAVGDGTTNDTQAIQDAFDSGYKNLYLPHGNYVVSDDYPVTPRRRAVVWNVSGGTLVCDGTFIADAELSGIIEVNGDNNTIKVNIDGKGFADHGIHVVGDFNTVHDSIVVNLSSTGDNCLGYRIDTTLGGCVVRDNRAENLYSEGLTRGISFTVFGDCEQPSMIFNNIVVDCMGDEGDSIQCLSTDGGVSVGPGNRYSALLTIDSNRIHNFSRRGVKVQCDDVTISNNKISHSLSEAELPTAQQAIGLVNGNNLICDSNELRNCFYMGQITAFSDGSYSLHNVCITNNKIYGLGSETESVSITVITYGGGCIVDGNYIEYGNSGAVAIGPCDDMYVHKNVFKTSEENTTTGKESISVSVNAANVIIDSNVFAGTSFRRAAILAHSNGMIVRNNICHWGGSALLRDDNATQASGVIIDGNILQGDISLLFTSTFTDKLIGNNFGANRGMSPIWVNYDLTELGSLGVFEGQFVFNTRPAQNPGWMGWEALSSGDADTISWRLIGSADS